MKKPIFALISTQILFCLLVSFASKDRGKLSQESETFTDYLLNSIAELYNYNHKEYNSILDDDFPEPARYMLSDTMKSHGIHLGLYFRDLDDPMMLGLYEFGSGDVLVEEFPQDMEFTDIISTFYKTGILIPDASRILLSEANQALGGEDFTETEGDLLCNKTERFTAGDFGKNGYWRIGYTIKGYEQIAIELSSGYSASPENNPALMALTTRSGRYLETYYFAKNTSSYLLLVEGLLDKIKDAGEAELTVENLRQHIDTIFELCDPESILLPEGYSKEEIFTHYGVEGGN